MTPLGGQRSRGAEAVVPPEGIDYARSPRSQLAWQAIEKLRSLSVPTADEAAALNTILRTRRPALSCTGGQVEGWTTATGRLRSSWKAFAPQVPRVIGSVGRIELKNEPTGSGFVVADHLEATNQHVLEELFPRGTQLRGAGIRFGITDEGQRGDLAELRRVAAIHDSVDLAVLQMDPASSCPPLLPVADTGPVRDEPVLLIGYPFADYQDPAFAAENFDGNLSLETLSPGRITRTGQRRDGVVEHDCQTLGGNSGSPLVSLDSGEVVAIHFNGKFLERNSAIPAPFLNELLKAGSLPV